MLVTKTIQGLKYCVAAKHSIKERNGLSITDYQIENIIQKDIIQQEVLILTSIIILKTLCPPPPFLTITDYNENDKQRGLYKM